jgi:acylphosphatase
MPIVTEKLTIRGDLASGDFPGWIIHRARRLGLRGGIVEIRDHAIELLVEGPHELVDAMEVGCSLGPTSVQVESIDRTPSNFELSENSFAYISNDKS